MVWENQDRLGEAAGYAGMALTAYGVHEAYKGCMAQ